MRSIILLCTLTNYNFVQNFRYQQGCTLRAGYNFVQNFRYQQGCTLRARSWSRRWSCHRCHHEVALPSPCLSTWIPTKPEPPKSLALRINRPRDVESPCQAWKRIRLVWTMANMGRSALHDGKYWHQIQVLFTEVAWFHSYYYHVPSILFKKYL